MQSFKSKKLPVLLSALLVGGTFTGSMTAAATGVAVFGAGTYSYVKGELNTSVGADFKQTADAALTTFRDYGIVIVNQQFGTTTGEINGRRADDTKVVVKLNQINSGVTEISLRVGVLGDEATSRNILDKIQSHLKVK